MPKKLNRKQFIEKAQKIHGDEYNYSKVDYKNYNTKVCIICPEHGEFWQTPQGHLNGCGCPKCKLKKNSDKRRIGTDEFIRRAKEIHSNKYDYSKVNYETTDTKVCIICPKHGEFWQTPHDHLKGSGCPKCNSKKLNSEQFIAKCKSKFGNKYDYSKVNYINNRTKVCIICPKHGEFFVKPGNFLHYKIGCPTCKNKIRYLTTKEFIEKAKKIHGDKYDYSKVNYKSSKTKVCIICPEHGEFWQKPNYHLDGCGCQMCKKSHLETELELFLKENNIRFISQYKNKWLGLQSLDFYLPDYNIAIECQGRQHFQPYKVFGGKKGLEIIKKRDKIKKDKCQINNVRLIYYSNRKFNKDIITSKKILLNEIIKNTKNQ